MNCHLLLCFVCVVVASARVSQSGTKKLQLHHSLAPYKSLRQQSIQRCALLCNLDLKCIAFSYISQSVWVNCHLHGCVNPSFRGSDLIKNVVYYDQERAPQMEDVNLALGKVASMSSTYESLPERDASRGSNGDTSRNDYFHTDSGYAEWWRVNMKCLYYVWEVRFYNRVQQGFFEFGVDNRAQDITITVAVEESDLFMAQNHCAFVSGNIAEYNIIKCNQPIPGRFVQLQNSLINQNSFHLREVEVYGTE